jgi:hypothetical protein
MMELDVSRVFHKAKDLLQLGHQVVARTHANDLGLTSPVSHLVALYLPVSSSLLEVSEQYVPKPAPNA